jgi:hypothetical protein
MDALLVTYWLSLAADYNQTTHMDKEKYHEVNPTLGRNPKRGAINTDFIGSAIALPVLSYKLPGGKYILLGATAAEVGIVVNNQRIGMRLHLRF